MGRRNKCTLEGPIWPQLERIARFSVGVCALAELYPDSIDHTMRPGGAHTHPQGDIDDGLPVICIAEKDMSEKYCTCGISALVYHEVAHAMVNRWAHHGDDWARMRMLLGHGAPFDIAKHQEPWEKPEGETLMETMARVEALV